VTTIPHFGITAGSHPLELDFLRAIKAKAVDLNFNHLKGNCDHATKRHPHE
jgi:hypothetical protein